MVVGSLFDHPDLGGVREVNDEDEDVCEADEDIEPPCSHIAIVSISDTECQCMDCLRVWPKQEGFKSDWPMADRG